MNLRLPHTRDVQAIPEKYAASAVDTFTSTKTANKINKA